MTIAHEDGELEHVLAIARRAATLVMKIYATQFDVDMKGPGDPVTQADRDANVLICDALAQAFPEDGILAEESVPTSTEEIANIVAKPRVWFVDPLDGTREYANRSPEFAVMIGLAVKGTATLGVVVMPHAGEAIAGRVGKGAFLELGSGARSPLDASGAITPGESTMIVSRSHRHSLVDKVAKRLGVAAVVPSGSVGVKVSRVVRGDAHLYVHAGLGAKLWDTCAPEAILVAAGGRFTDLGGSRVDYASADLTLRNGIVAARPSLVTPIVDAVRAAREAN